MNARQPKSSASTSAAGRAQHRWSRVISDSELKKLLARGARANPKTAPPAKGKKGAAPAGQVLFMRPLCDDLECPPVPDPDDDNPTDPCAGQVFVWQPDIAVQINTGESTCPSAADLLRVQNGVGSNLSRFRLPDPDVRVSCTGGKIFIRIWGTRVPPGSCSEQARQRAQVPDLVGGGNFGLFINATLMRRLADQAFLAAPKQLSGNGAPSPFGPIHLTGLSIELKSPHTIITRITGYDERPWPDVHFTHIITDELRPLRECRSESQTDTEKGPAILGELALISLSFAVPLVIPLAALVLFGDIDALVNSPGGGGSEGGFGCRLAASLPDEIPLPQEGGLAPPVFETARKAAARVRVPDTALQPKRQKLVIAYAQPTVDSRGLFVGALASRQDRVPTAHVSGPSNLTMLFPGSQTFGDFVAVSDDFFGGRSFQWSAGPNTQIENPTGSRTRITFRRGNAPRGEAFERTVRVRVTDSEGSSATASKIVTVFVNEDDNLPPICQVRPWLPQCNPQEI